MRRRWEQSFKLYPHIERFSSSTTMDIPPEWIKMDLFLIGGGGSGGAWYTWGYSPGGGGTGGQCRTYLDIPLRSNGWQIIHITVGKGGEAINVSANAPGKNGGKTIVQLNKLGLYSEFEAEGGYGGKKCIPVQDSEDYRSIAAQGWDARSDSLSFINPDRQNLHLIDVYDGRGSKVIDRLNTNNYPFNAPYELRRGVEEFHEPGNPIHAAGGTSFSNVKPVTDFNINVGYDFANTIENILIRGGGGFGGGGAGGFYRFGVTGKGGDGGVVIRYYTANKNP